MSRIRVLHVFGQFRCGGPLQALISAKKRSDNKLGIEHHVASIRPADRYASEQAAANGISGTSAPSPDVFRQLMAELDIVHVHFWNNPEIYTFLSGDLPPMRLLLWCWVNGRPPQVIPEPLLTFSDLVVVTARMTLEYPEFARAPSGRVSLVQCVADFNRVADCRPLAHDGFRVGYIGTVHFTKMHESFVDMCAAVSVPIVRFFVCGDGGAHDELKRQASELGILNRFEFHGYTNEISPYLAAFDVFGYPLTAENYSTSELALQEAMYAGIPPVVFPYGGPGEVVTHQKNGLVVGSRQEYSAAIEWLYRHPEERKRMGEQAAHDMRQRERVHGSQSDLIYERIMTMPKRARSRIGASCIPLSEPSGRSGAQMLVRSLGGQGDVNFLASLNSTVEGEAEAADERIAAASAVWHDVILQYRVRYPEDPYLRLWAGLALRAMGRPAVAAAEFWASISLGCNAPRVRRYYAEVKTSSADRLRSSKLM